MDEISKLEQLRMRIIMEGESRKTDSQNMKDLIAKKSNEITSYLKNILNVLLSILAALVIYMISQM